MTQITHKTGFAYDPDYIRHDTGPNHPECPERLLTSFSALQASDLWTALHPIHPTPATRQQLCYAHAPTYPEYIQRYCDSEIPLTYDTTVVKASFDVAKCAAGAVLSLADAVVTGEIKNGFAMVRPPGHHATHDRSMGFCLFNNIAIAARYLQRDHGIGKVAIIDWDVHHGNGTHDIFYEDSSVFFFSIHQSPHYPGTGSSYERGSGAARGTTLNVPVPAGSTDTDYIAVFTDTLLPALRDYSPEVILISAGFDAHHLDPLGGIQLTTEGFATLTDLVLELAAETASGRVVSALEGGYSLTGLSESILAHLTRLSNFGTT